MERSNTCVCGITELTLSFDDEWLKGAVMSSTPVSMEQRKFD